MSEPKQMWSHMALLLMKERYLDETIYPLYFNFHHSGGSYSYISYGIEYENESGHNRIDEQMPVEAMFEFLAEKILELQNAVK